MSSNFFYVFLFTLGGFLMLTVILGIAKLLRPNKPNEEKLSTYESGEEVGSNAIVSFNIQYYVTAIVFLLFEVELVLLFPWATIFGDKNLITETNGQWAWYAIIEMFLFLFVLALGLAYAWKEGHLDWPKAKQNMADFKSKIPKEVYHKFNQEQP